MDHEVQTKETPTQTPVCVIGMHRSGSSAMTELLCANGFSAGSNLIGATPSNPHGHFEDRFLVQSSKKILLHFGGAWDRPPVLPGGWMDDPFVQDLLVKVRDYANRQLLTLNAVVIKDPRFCLLLPFFQEAMGPMRYVVTFRNRADISRSIVRRNQTWRSAKKLPWRVARSILHRFLGAYEPIIPLDADQAAALWDCYNESLVDHLTGQQVVLVHYENLLAQPEAEASRILKGLNADISEVAATGIQPGFNHGKGLEPDAESLQHAAALAAANQVLGGASD